QGTQRLPEHRRRLQVHGGLHRTPAPVGSRRCAGTCRQPQGRWGSSPVVQLRPTYRDLGGHVLLPEKGMTQEWVRNAIRSLCELTVPGILKSLKEGKSWLAPGQLVKEEDTGEMIWIPGLLCEKPDMQHASEKVKAAVVELDLETVYELLTKRIDAAMDED